MGGIALGGDIGIGTIIFAFVLTALVTPALFSASDIRVTVADADGVETVQAISQKDKDAGAKAHPQLFQREVEAGQADDVAAMFFTSMLFTVKDCFSASEPQLA